MFVAPQTMLWILSQPPAFSMYELNAHWHTHQCLTGQVFDASPSHAMLDEHQLGCLVLCAGEGRGESSERESKGRANERSRRCPDSFNVHGAKVPSGNVRQVNTDVVRPRVVISIDAAAAPRESSQCHAGTRAPLEGASVDVLVRSCTMVTKQRRCENGETESSYAHPKMSGGPSFPINRMMSRVPLSPLFTLVRERSSLRRLRSLPGWRVANLRSETLLELRRFAG